MEVGTIRIHLRDQVGNFVVDDISDYRILTIILTKILDSQENGFGTGNFPGVPVAIGPVGRLVNVRSCRPVRYDHSPDGGTEERFPD